MKRYYSLHDRSNALTILSAPELMTEEMIGWAEAVQRWFNNFYNLLSKYAKRLKSAALAMKCIWSNIKAGFTVEKMLWKMTTRVLELAEGVTGRNLKKGNLKGKDGYRMPTMKNRSSKYRRHSYTGRWNDLVSE